MKKRIFLSINLPEKIKNKLAEYQEKWDIPVKWTNKDNLHITLVFLGYTKDENLGLICESVEEVVKKSSPFVLKLEKVCYNDLKDIPRMVWVVGKKNSQLDSLKNNLENSLSRNNFSSPQRKSFIPHVTLGRIKKWQFRKMEPEDIPEIKEEISLSFEVNSIELMNSVLKRKGPKYEILQSFQLND